MQSFKFVAINKWSKYFIFLLLFVCLMDLSVTLELYPLQLRSDDKKITKIGFSEVFEDELDLKLIRKKEAFIKILNEKVLPYIQKNQRKPIKCFISYAWARKEHKDYEEQKYHEYWVEQFALMLKAAGLEIFLDRWEDKKGKQINYFIEKIEDSDFIFIIGTPLYLEKYKTRTTELQVREAVVRFEASLIQNTISYSSNNSERVIPVLLAGVPQESFPPLIFRIDKIPCNFIENDYFDELLKLIHDLYGIENQDNLFKSFAEEFRVTALAIDTQITPIAQKEFRKKQLRDILNKQSEIEKRVDSALKISPNIIKYLPNFNDVQKPIVWNLPRQDHLFVGREKLLEELDQKLHFKEKYPNEAAIVSVCAGLGGVGKTQLALQYIHHTKHLYRLKVWFQAENIDQLKQQYIELAKILGYAEERISINTALSYIKEWLLTHTEWLLVYDNVSNYEIIKEFLPEGKGNIILTTRQQKWPNKFGILDIDLMSEEDSIKLIESLVHRSIVEAEKEQAKELAKTLGYLPLALAQASAYIQQNRIKIKEYLILYKDYEQQLLEDNTLPEGVNSLPVAVTWNISLEAITRENKEKKQPIFALHLLSACAYLAPDGISHHLLLTWLKESYPDLSSSEIVLSKLMKELWEYSMLHREENGDVTLHRLVQTVIRQQHKRSLGEKKLDYPLLTLNWYNVLLNSAHIEFNRKTQILEDEARKKKLLPHLQILLDHYSNMWPNASKFNLVHIMNDMGTAFFLVGEPKMAKFYYENALKIKEQYYGKNHIQVALTLDDLGKGCRYLGNLKEARYMHERSLNIKEKYYGKDHVELANTLTQLGTDYRDLGDIREAKELHERALKIKEKHYGKDHVEISFILTQLGRAYRYLGNAEKAKLLHERALIIKEKNYGKEHPEVANTLDQLGSDYRELGDTESAKNLHERALLILEKRYSNNHVTISWTLDQLGRDYRCLGDFKRAKEVHERALKIKEQHYGNDHIEAGWTLDQLGGDYKELGEFGIAKELHERALKIKKQHYGRDNIEIALTLDYLGNDYRSLGDARKARELHEYALNIKKGYYGRDHSEIAFTLDFLGDDYRDLGKTEEAKRLHEQALNIKETYYGIEHAEVAKTLMKLIDIHTHLGNIKEAVNGCLKPDENVGSALKI